jgi:hypothetical protein
VIESQSELLYNKHIERCLRRGPTTSNSSEISNKKTKAINYKEKEENFEDDENYEELMLDEDSNEDNTNISRKTTKNRNNNKNNKNNKLKSKKYLNENSSDVTSEDDEMVVDYNNNNNNIQDDWEDDVYDNRLSLISDDNNEFINTPFGTTVNKNSWNKLYEYQMDGCNWLFNLYQEGVGAMLGFY